MDLSNVSRRLEGVRLLADLTARGLDKIAGRPAGTCAIIEAKEQQSVRLHVATSYATALGISVGWLMTGTGSIIEDRPELDMARARDRASIAERVKTAARAAMPIQRPGIAKGAPKLARTGTEG